VLLPIYNVLWLLAVYFSGGYDKPVRVLKIIRGIFVGTGIILIMYALLPEGYRFSRALNSARCSLGTRKFIIHKIDFFAGRNQEHAY